MKITLHGKPQFRLPLTLADVDVLCKLSSMHYDSVCKQASVVGGFLYGWQGMLRFSEEEGSEPLAVSGDFRTLDTCLKIMEGCVPGRFCPVSAEDAARVEAMRTAIRGALQLANEVSQGWTATYEQPVADFASKTFSLEDPVEVQIDDVVQVNQPTTEFVDNSQKSRLAAFQEALDKAYSSLQCHRALRINSGDAGRAAKWLTDGEWLNTQMVSWNHVSLAEKAQSLQVELGLHPGVCLATLKACGGQVDLARRKLTGQPLLRPDVVIPA
jgi:hypothetical protein